MTYLISIAVLLLGYMLALAHRNTIKIHHTDAPITKDCKLYFISDVHNRKINQRMLVRVGKVDAVIIGGDFCDKRTSFARLEENLRRLSMCGKLYFVWGNNDRELNEVNLRAIFKQYDVTILENSAVPLTKDIWLSAIEDTSSRKYSFEAALQHVPEDAYRIFISHNPAVFPRVLAAHTVNFLLAGHWHGGQIRLGPLGVRPNGSYAIVQGVPTLISNGYGTTLLPLRLGAAPQTHIITLHATKDV